MLFGKFHLQFIKVTDIHTYPLNYNDKCSCMNINELCLRNMNYTLLFTVAKGGVWLNHDKQLQMSSSDRCYWIVSLLLNLYIELYVVFLILISMSSLVMFHKLTPNTANFTDGVEPDYASCFVYLKLLLYLLLPISLLTALGDHHILPAPILLQTARC